MVQQIHVLFTHLVKMICSLDTHCRNLNPVPVFPIAARRRHFPQVNLGIKIGRKCISMVAAVAVENVNGLYLVKFMLERIGAVCLRHTRIKTRTEQCRDAGFLKFFPVCPLPRIVKICREAFLPASLVINRTPCRIVNIFWLIVRSVHIVYLTCKACIHNCQVLIRKCNIHDKIWLIAFYQSHHFLYVVCIYLCRCNLCIRLPLQLLF